MRILPSALLLFAVACGEMLDPASTVSDFRVVAARVEAGGSPERANPSPGDPVTVSLRSIDRGMLPSDTPDATLSPGLLQWQLVPCLPAPVTIGPPICLQPIQPCTGCEATPPGDPLAEPVVTFDAPTEEALEQADASSILLQGVLCSNGAPDADAIRRFLLGESDDLSPCRESDDSSTVEGVPVQGRFVSVTIPIEDAPDDPNTNPELLNVLYQDGAWPAPYDEGVPRDAPVTGCAADLDGLPEDGRADHPRAGSPSSLVNLFVTRDSLQTYEVDGTAVTEEIQVSWLADTGSFERSFSFITAPATSVLTQWQPPADAPEDGTLVRFNFVVRDGRGGTDWVERGLCVLPAE